MVNLVGFLLQMFVVSRVFPQMFSDLNVQHLASYFAALRDSLLSAGVTTVAMEATGVYWLPVYEVLEAAGLDVQLVLDVGVRDDRQVGGAPGVAPGKVLILGGGTVGTHAAKIAVGENPRDAPDLIDRQAYGWGDEHRAQPLAVSITQTDTCLRLLDETGVATAPGVDFDQYANGAWRKATEIPADLGSIGRAALRPHRDR